MRGSCKVEQYAFSEINAQFIMLRPLAVGYGRKNVSRSDIGAKPRPRRTFRTSSLSRDKYQDAYKLSLQKPQEFWAKAAEGIDWFVKYNRVLDDDTKPLYRWFTGGQTNVCFNALDRHLATRGNQTALIYDSPLTQSQKKYTFKELKSQVELFSGVLSSAGVRKGDTVIIYMPMIPEAVIAILACARIGAVHSVVFGGFAADQLAVRINHARAKVVVTASGGVEPNRVIPYKPLVDAAIKASLHKPDKVILYQRPNMERASMTPGRDLDWEEEMETAKPHDCVPVASTDPLYIIYTSGTTGDPKGIVRDCGGYSVALRWSMKNIYDMNPGETFWAASDIGWVVGHSYIVYGPLLAGLTTILYEGKPVTPDAGAYWRVIQEHKVKAFFTAPTAFRTIKREDPEGSFVKKYDLSSLQSLWLAGERADPDTVMWAERILPEPVPVIDHWWQTETGWPAAANCLGLGRYPTKYGSCTHAVPGWDIRVVDDEGTLVQNGKLGNIVIKLPLPPGSLVTLYQDDNKYKKSYLDRFNGYYQTGDAGILDPEGYLHIMSRTDDIINVSGVRLSTGAMEEVLSSHPSVAEVCCIGTRDALKGQIPVGFLVLKSHAKDSPEQVVKDCIALVREKIGPVASFKSAVVVDCLPKTRSGKILRATLAKMANGDHWITPATIENPAALDIAQRALESIGLPPTKAN